MRFFLKYLLWAPFAVLAGCGDYFNQPFINHVQQERFAFEQDNEILRLALKNPWLPIDIGEDLVQKQGQIEAQLAPVEKIMLKYNIPGMNDNDFSIKYVPRQAIKDNRAVKKSLQTYHREILRTLVEFGNVGPSGLPLEEGVCRNPRRHREHRPVVKGWGRVLVQDSPLMQDLLPRPWDEGVGTQARLQERAAEHQEKGENWGRAFPRRMKAPALPSRKANREKSSRVQHNEQVGGRSARKDS